MPACGKVPRMPCTGLAFPFAPPARPGGEREGLGRLPRRAEEHIRALPGAGRRRLAGRPPELGTGPVRASHLHGSDLSGPRRPAGGWGVGGGGPVVRGQGPSFSSLRPLTAVWFSFRQLMAQEPLEKLGFGDLIDGKSETKTKF